MNLIVFFSPTCPICKYYTNSINNIVDSLKINVTVFVPKKSILSRNEITQYFYTYKPHFKLQYDKRNKMVRKFHPIVTPEFYLIRNDSVLYKGAFDDKFIELGKKKSVIQHHYLLDAINGIKNNLHYIKETIATGCFISYE